MRLRLRVRARFFFATNETKKRSLPLPYLSRIALARSELKSSNWITQLGQREARLRITSSMILKKSSPTILRRLRPK